LKVCDRRSANSSGVFTFFLRADVANGRQPAAFAVLLAWAMVFVASHRTFGGQGDCSQPVSTAANPTAADCLFILRTAIGSEACTPECVCDPNGDGSITAPDALVCLRKAVGQAQALECPCLPDTTETTEACSDNCQAALEVCGDELFFDEYSSVEQCAEECVNHVLDFIDDADDAEACVAAQTDFIECCTRDRQCAEIPDCDSEFEDAANACGGSFV
jgi:hypothetical protein